MAGPSSNKPGLEANDKTIIAKKILELSKGSLFLENEQRRNLLINQRIAKLKDKKASLHCLKEYEQTALTEFEVLKAQRQSFASELVVHLDMDAFFASVAELDEPSLKGKPMAVGVYFLPSSPLLTMPWREYRTR